MNEQKPVAVGCTDDPRVRLDLIAASISERIFEIGDEEGSVCTRIQFMGGSYPNERGQGGMSQVALARVIQAELEKRLKPNKPGERPETRLEKP